MTVEVTKAEMHVITYALNIYRLNLVLNEKSHRLSEWHWSDKGLIPGLLGRLEKIEKEG